MELKIGQIEFNLSRIKFHLGKKSQFHDLSLIKFEIGWREKGRDLPQSYDKHS